MKRGAWNKSSDWHLWCFPFPGSTAWEGLSCAQSALQYTHLAADTGVRGWSSPGLAEHLSCHTPHFFFCPLGLSLQEQLSWALGWFFQLTQVRSLYDLALELMPHGFHQRAFPALLYTSWPFSHAPGMLSHCARTRNSARQISPFLLPGNWGQVALNKI